MEIRTIEPADNQALEKIIKSSLESFGLDRPGTAYFDPHLGNLSDYYAALSRSLYWVLVDESQEVVGGVGIAVFDEMKSIAELQKLYLIPEIQGKGWAKRLINIALEFASNYYLYCYLETMQILEQANRLYEWAGFEKLAQPLAGSEHTLMDTWYIKNCNIPEV
ncbi:MAG TPA: GNAT family N-acetyltransferase [Pseudogracilibacillus sp.]|nr:GNAT family N-acetyltransferase [Pseudogracilibacillus sp.]